MCDTIAVVTDDGVLFAKNSDRDPNEGQALEWHPAAEHPPGAELRCTWITVPQAPRTRAVLISRPFWMWGAEMGANARGVVIGNEAVFTRERPAKTGLTGMDLLRLALERADTADEAVEVIVSLAAAHGQGGGAGHEHRGFRYHSSFIVADPRGAIVLETAGPHHATERVRGVRAISNGLTIPGFAEAHGDRLKTAVSACRARRARTEALARPAPAALMAALRDHGGARWPRYRRLNGTLAMPCMHGGGIVASSVTTASWVAEVTAGRHWVTATAAPCLSLFKPASVGEPLDLGPSPGERADGSLWWLNERLHRRVMRDPAAASGFLAERDAVEAGWLAAPPQSAAAFAQHRTLLERWLRETPAPADRRPGWVRRYWRRRDRRAGIAGD